MSKLYIVATPVGNLEDITLRALRVLKEVQLVLCEDTRVTRKLLDHYGISTGLATYNEMPSGNSEERVLGLLRDGKNIALVSDAGTPGISDPGTRLVGHIRANMPKTEIVAIPGPTALIAALSVSGLSANDFLFLGFLPHKKGRQTLFKEIAESKRTVVFYESPHRFLKSLESLEVVLTDDRKITVCRELTKIHEETKTGTVKELLDYYGQNDDKIRGEFVVVVSAR